MAVFSPGRIWGHPYSKPPMQSFQIGRDIGKQPGENTGGGHSLSSLAYPVLLCVLLVGIPSLTGQPLNFLVGVGNSHAGVVTMVTTEPGLAESK